MTAKNASRTAEIHFRVTLDERQLPVGIEWSATDAPEEGPRPTKSVLLSVWNAEERKAMAVDLWTDEMLVDEMKLFFFQTLATMADTFERATSEREIADEIRRFASDLAVKMGLTRAVI